MYNQTATFTRIARLVNEASCVALLTDERSDGDTFGSSLAFSLYLRGLGKRVVHVAGSPIPEALTFLPDVETVQEDWEVLHDPAIDLAIVFDSSRQTHVEAMTAHIERPVPLIVFDHHASNTHFGDVNAVYPDVSSTCEVVHAYLDQQRVQLTPAMAQCLMTGMMTDTGVLSNPVTNPEVVDRASSLLLEGARISTVVEHVVENMSVEQLMLWGRLLERLVHHPRYDVATVWVTDEDFAATGTQKDAIDEFMDYLQAHMDVRAVFFLKQRPSGGIKVSMRARDIDMTRIATCFGGGGHPGACGFSVSAGLQVDGNQAQVHPHTA